MGIGFGRAGKKWAVKDIGIFFTRHFFAVFCLYQVGAFNLDICLVLKVLDLMAN